jgi:hypothetical protein
MLMPYSRIRPGRRGIAALTAFAAGRPALLLLLVGAAFATPSQAQAQETSSNPFSRYVNVQANGVVLSPVPVTGMPGSVQRVVARELDMIRFTLRPPHHRSELVLPYQPFGAPTSYKFTYLIPEDWVDEVGGKQLFFQMHGADGDSQEVAQRSPCFALQIRTDQVFISMRTDTEAVTLANPKERLVGSWPIEKGKLVDVEVIAKWAYDATGELEVYKDGVPIYSGTGPNCYNDTRGPYPKIGIYHWESFPSYITKQTLYTTDLLIRQLEGGN